MHLYKRVTREERISPNDFPGQRSRSFEVNKEIPCVHDLERAVSQITMKLCVHVSYGERTGRPLITVKFKGQNSRSREVNC